MSARTTIGLTSGKTLLSLKIANNEAEIVALLINVGSFAGQLTWAVDIIGASLALLLALLTQAGQTVRYASGRMVAAMSAAYTGEGKTDAKDAYVIAETARLRPDLTVIDSRTDQVWQFWYDSSLSGPLSTLTPVLGIRLPSASTRYCDNGNVVVSHLHSVKQRLAAHDVGAPSLVGAGRRELPVDQVSRGADPNQVADVAPGPRQPIQVMLA